MAIASRPRAVPAPAFVLGAAVSVQGGAAVAKSLFPELGPPGVVFLRLLFGGIALWAFGRPRLRGRSGRELRLVAMLGLALVLAAPVGEHERMNAGWALEHGAALRQHAPEAAARWLAGWLADGTLAETAWRAFRALPQQGLYDIAARFSSSAALSR